MRDINEIKSDLTSERENRDYIETRIAHFESTLDDTTPGTTGHSYTVRRLISLNIQLDESMQCIRLLKAERDAASAALVA